MWLSIIIHRSFVKKESDTLEASGDLFTLQHIQHRSFPKFCASFLNRWYLQTPKTNKTTRTQIFARDLACHTSTRNHAKRNDN